MSKEDQLKNMRFLASVLHGVYFGTLQALREEEEFFDVYGTVVKSVNKIIKSYFKHMEGKDVAKIISELEETGLYQGLELKQNGDKRVFTIKKCLFAGGEDGVHSSIKTLDLPCPIALAIGVVLSRQNPDKRVYVYPSVYEPEGTVTQMDLITPEDYKKRLNSLQKLSRNAK